MQLQDLVQVYNDCCAAAYTGDGASNRAFEIGNHAVRMRGCIIETGYEFFEPTCEVALDGEMLFGQDATSVGSYHNETYNYGKYDSFNETMVALYQNFGNAELKEIPFFEEPRPVQTEHRWKNEQYAAQRAAEDALQVKRDEATRLVWKDLGEIKPGAAAGNHRVVFAHACDSNPDIPSLQDGGMPNPYVNSHVVNKRVYHDQIVSQDELDRLSSVTHSYNPRLYDNYESSWVGVVNARVKDGRVNLSEEDLADGVLTCPRHGLDAKAHDRFVKTSVAMSRNEKISEQTHVSKIERDTSHTNSGGRALPKVPDTICTSGEFELV